MRHGSGPQRKAALGMLQEAVWRVRARARWEAEVEVITFEMGLEETPRRVEHGQRNGTGLMAAHVGPRTHE